MNQKVTEIRVENWRKTIYECIHRDPKISKKQWCRENGIYYRSLMYWQRKFQMEAFDLMENHETTLPVKQDPACVPVFADMTDQLEAIRAEQGSVSTEPETTPLAPELMIQVGPYRVYVNSSIREATLETVMRVIGRA